MLSSFPMVFFSDIILHLRYLCIDCVSVVNYSPIETGSSCQWYAIRFFTQESLPQVTKCLLDGLIRSLLFHKSILIINFYSISILKLIVRTPSRYCIITYCILLCYFSLLYLIFHLIQNLIDDWPSSNR